MSGKVPRREFIYNPEKNSSISRIYRMFLCKCFCVTLRFFCVTLSRILLYTWGMVTIHLRTLHYRSQCVVHCYTEHCIVKCDKLFPNHTNMNALRYLGGTQIHVCKYKGYYSVLLAITLMTSQTSAAFYASLRVSIDLLSSKSGMRIG